ncbi:MAG: RnfH family protein [Mariprofundaceae bacterium]
MKVSVVYALPHRQDVIELDVPEGATVLDAVHLSGILEMHPEIDLKMHKLGVFAKLAKPDQPLREGDRVEIYRPLPRKPRDPHAVDAKKTRIRERKAARKPPCSTGVQEDEGSSS